MNQQLTAYVHYPAPPQQVQYTYAAPYPTQQANPYPAYTASQQQQINAQAQAQYFHPFPPQQSIPSHGTAQQQSIPSQGTTPQQVTPIPQQQQQQQCAQASSSSKNLSHVQQQAQHNRSSLGFEDHLRSALRTDGNGAQTDAENGGNNDDDDDDDDDADDDDHADPGDDDDDHRHHNEPADENQPIFNLPPPPEGNYASEQELEKSIHAWSLEHGYEMVRRASKKNAAGTIYKRYYHCSKHGKLANTGKLTQSPRIRTKRKSNRTGCPMSLAAVAFDPTHPEGEWQIRHRKAHHNHGPLDALQLAGHRRRARMGGVEKAVGGLFAIGTPTTQVLQFLQRTNPDGLFTRTDVANMKLKWKKYGTCTHLPNQYARDPDKALGLRTACVRCRERRVRCDSVRPTCQNCTADSVECGYDFEPSHDDDAEAGADEDTAIDVHDATRPTGSRPSRTPQSRQPPSNSAVRKARNQSAALGARRAQTEQILQDLQSFQAEHVKPERLELNSSSVEILANSSCGNGDSYKALPVLATAADYQVWSDSFIECSLKENTLETLTGQKVEPARPTPPGEGQEVEVEEWNEYVRQLAIYTRRNGLLLGALWGSVASSFRTRIMGLKKATQAWAALEDICSPRGSDQAFALYQQLHDTTLQSCGDDLQLYIGTLEARWNEFARLKQSLQYPHDRLGRYRLDLQPVPQARQHSFPTQVARRDLPPGTGADVVTEEALCFLFLRNLGEVYKRWVDTLCQTNNVGGFGTGFQVGFRELVNRVGEWEGMQRGQGNSAAG